MILLLGNYPPDAQSSMARYAKLLNRGLKEAGHAVNIWYPPVLFGKMVRPESSAFKWFAYIDKLVIAPLVLLSTQIGADRIHICDHSNSFYSFVIFGRPCTVTCHDVIAIQAARGLVSGWRVGRLGPAYQWLISKGLTACGKVYCVSDHTRRNLLSLGIASAQKTSVLYNPVEPIFAVDGPPDEVFLTPGFSKAIVEAGPRYFLHVGTNHERKNRDMLFNIFVLLANTIKFAECKLFLIGPPPDTRQRELLLAHGVAANVVAISKISDSELAHVYRHAIALIFPSVQEGFGWPVAEAMSCGCPVIASAADPMLEIGGTAARYIDLADTRSAVDTILDAPLALMRQEGPLHASRYTLNAATSALLR